MAAQPIPKAHTTLGSYADKMGINPVHFFGGNVPGLFAAYGACNSTWLRHTWQNDDNVSREDLAYQLVNSERTMAEYLGYPVYPQWIELDVPYPMWDNGMYDRYGQFKTIATQVGYVHAGGVRAQTKVASGLPVAYTDPDGDTYKEKAAVDMTGIYDSAWFDDYGQIVVVPAGYGIEFAIDSYVSLDETELVMRAWVMVDPEKDSQFPFSEEVRLNLTDPAILVEEVDLYRVYNDPTGACTFQWGSGLNQSGTIQVLDVAAGIVRPIPSGTSWCTGTYPVRVKLSIYAGHKPNNFWVDGADIEHSKLDPLFAEAIRFMTTARLDRQLCGCNNIIAIYEDLRQDMALVSPQGNFLAVADIIQACPFGTRRGEWLAWNKVRGFHDKYVSTALV